MLASMNQHPWSPTLGRKREGGIGSAVADSSGSHRSLAGAPHILPKLNKLNNNIVGYSAQTGRSRVLNRVDAIAPQEASLLSCIR